MARPLSETITGVGTSLRVADLLDREHDGVRVFLQAVVDAASSPEVARAVVHAEAAADVEVRDARCRASRSCA